MTPVRRIRLEHLHNLRDLGGYEAAEGRATAWNRVYRCDCPRDLTEDEWEQLRNLGIRTLVDLRSTFECAEKPVEAPEGFTYVHCPFLWEEKNPRDPHEASRKFLESLSLDYGYMMERCLDRAATTLDAITRALPNGGVAFFCTAGKDRTGMVAACLLRLCGVGDDDIVADYCQTEVYNAAVIQRQIQSLPDAIRESISPQSMEAAMSSKSPTMRSYLQWLDEHDLARCLDEQGFSYRQQQLLAERMCAAPDA